MTPRKIGDLLDRIGCVNYSYDLDLLVFFHRHPHAFLKSERLAEYVGYDLSQVEQSLQTLMTAGLLRQSPDSTRPARLYVLTRSSSTLGRCLSSLLRIAATRQGRLAVLDVLKQRHPATRSRDGGPEPVANARPDSRTPKEPHA